MHLLHLEMKMQQASEKPNPAKIQSFCQLIIVRERGTF
jgi:hypothetical protein